MVMITRGCGSSSSTDVEPINKRMHEFITFDIMWGIFDATYVIFGSFNEGIMEILYERLGVACAEIMVGQLGARTLTFREFKAC